MDEKQEKLANAILLVSKLCRDERFFGNTHMNKVLAWADRYHFKITGKSITGTEYYKYPNGYVSKELYNVRHDLEVAGRISTDEREIAPGYTQKRTIPIDEPKLDLFTELERELLEGVTKFACKMPAHGVSDLSHDLSWELAGNKELIPFFTVHTSRVNAIDESSKEWARQLTKMLD